MTDKAEVDALVNWTVQTYGAIDLLVSNAGIVKGADFLDMSETDFDDVIRVNLKGTFLVSAHLLRAISFEHMASLVVGLHKSMLAQQ